MSTSRLEKFIYAICSMEVSDLPAPLSRIEILWNCLITGETPDFEPISRNEKYLMAMLDRYDISNLPAPMSRGEKLLYKIAVGETDLSDVPGYLSRYEELLKYLIENGGISGGDFEYVLYTLNQSLSTLYSTAEKPVKSAILKGNTLVNLINYNDKSDFIRFTEATIAEKYITLTGKNSWGSSIIFKSETVNLKPNTDYTVIIDIQENTLTQTGQTTVEIGSVGNVSNGYFDGFIRPNLLGILGNKKILFSTKSDFSDVTSAFVFRFNNTVSGTLKFRISVVEGDYTNIDIPYFEGMQSVKMPVLTTTGKNLFDEKYQNLSDFTYDEDGIQLTTNKRLVFQSPVKIQANKTYIGLIEYSGGCASRGMGFNDVNQKGLYPTYRFSPVNSSEVKVKQIKFTPTSDTYLVSIHNGFDHDGVLSPKIHKVAIFESSNINESYEPYKSNILTVNEPIELRGIDDIKDTLDLATGELIQRVDKVVLDGGEDKDFKKGHWDKENTVTFYLNFDETSTTSGRLKFLSDKLQFNISFYSVDEECMIYTANVDGSVAMYIRVLRSHLEDISVVGLKSYLSKNPIIILRELINPIIKTVDLTTVDQDGQPTTLKTFNDISYVKINSDNIIPSVDVEVATKISETLSTLGLEHHDISETQNKLGQNIDEQAENTDATMMATTEIYEQTL